MVPARRWLSPGPRFILSLIPGSSISPRSALAFSNSRRYDLTYCPRCLRCTKIRDRKRAMVELRVYLVRRRAGEVVLFHGALTISAIERNA